MSGRIQFVLGSFISLMAAVASAGEADVEAVAVQRSADGSYRFDVTLRHADAGWDHYADRWEVLSPAGDVIATRTLFHPHVDEQPFTRSLSGVKIPAGIERVVIRAHDSVHGYGGQERAVALATPSQ
jgi:hypothetical protein